jgi:hypothetical protein
MFWNLLVGLVATSSGSRSSRHAEAFLKPKLDPQTLLWQPISMARPESVVLGRGHGGFYQFPELRILL